MSTTSTEIELLLGKPVFIVPFYIGVLIAAQVMLITIAATIGEQFKGFGAIIFIPSYILIARICLFLFITKKRTHSELRNLARHRVDENEIGMSAQFLIYENSKNELFCYKLLALAPAVILANLKIDLKKEHFTWWVVGGYLMGYFLLVGFEGAHHNKWWWDDEREQTRALISSNEEDGGSTFN